MGEFTKLSPELVEEVVALYAQGEPVARIAEKYGVGGSYISRLANARGIRRNLERGGKQMMAKATAPEKKCPHCKARNPQMAKYCMFCGKDVRDEKQILIERVEALRAMTALLPDSVQGEADEITRMVLKYLGRR